MKFFKNKFFIITLAVALVLTIFISVFAFMGLGGAMKNAVNTVTMPIRDFFNFVGESFSGFGEYFRDMDGLIDENQKLKDEISSLEAELRDADLAVEENERLREYLEIKKAHNDFKMTEALVIGQESDNYMSVIMLDRGSGDGIEVGMPVITSEGVVGLVCEVGYSWCKVKTLLEDNVSVGVYDSRSGETGIVKGDISYKGSGKCKLTYLDADADIEIDDAVYTSGNGSVYPRGLYVGKIASIGTNEYTRTKTAEISCGVDFESLKYVMIITDFEIYEEPTEN